MVLASPTPNSGGLVPLCPVNNAHGQSTEPKTKLFFKRTFKNYDKHADPYVSVDAYGDDFSFVEDDLLDVALVALLLAARDFDLADAAVPQQHVAPLAAGQHLAAGQLRVPVDVGDLLLAELAEMTLQLQPGECVRHLPESAAARASRYLLSRKFFQDIAKPTSCLHHLLPDPKLPSYNSRLRSYEKLPRPYTRTKQYRSFAQYALSHYQDRVYND